MAEIYVAILNTACINAKVIGVESKGDVDGAVKEDGTIIDVPEIYDCYFDDNFEIIIGENEKSSENLSHHYYTMFETDGTEYIQDFLIDNALFRIKTGEASMSDSIPGFCLKEDYKSRAKQSLPLAHEYIERIRSEYKEYTNESNSKKELQFLFEQLKIYNKEFGFEEAKDFLLLTSKLILPRNFNPQNLRIINLLKEDESTCDIISIYHYNKVNYLLRNGEERTAVKYDFGEISTKQIKTLLSQGFNARKKSDELTLYESIIQPQPYISMQTVVSNAIAQGIATEDVEESDKVEHKKIQEYQIEGVTRDD